MKKNFKRLLVILLAIAPMAFAAACNQPNNSASDKYPSGIVEEETTEEEPSEETPPEEESTEVEPPEQTPTKPSLPGGLQDGGNFVGRG